MESLIHDQRFLKISSRCKEIIPPMDGISIRGECEFC
nr:MAG TPA: hypothetical protein [Caudoviricetes sp.]